MRLVAIGGSDAGISSALRVRELDPSSEVTVVLADTYPNFSICGIPYYVSGEVGQWQCLAHRTIAELEAIGITLKLDTRAQRIDTEAHEVIVSGPDGGKGAIEYDALVIATGALPVRPPIAGLDRLDASDGVHLLHSMGDTFALMRTLEQPGVERAVIVGAGYIGLEMAEALSMRGLAVTQLEQLPEVLPTIDPELGALVRTELERHHVTVHCHTRVEEITVAPDNSGARLEVLARSPEHELLQFPADVAIVVVGVRPHSELATSAGAALGAKDAIIVDRQMRTNLTDVFAAGDCVLTHHCLLGTSYTPLGTTAHKQGRIAGENALGGTREFSGTLGTQVVKVFDLVAARTGLRDDEAARFDPVTVGSVADDHTAYYPGSHPITMRYTGDRRTGRLLGVQLVGHRNAQIAKRIDIPATAIHNELTVEQLSDLDLSYTPPLGSPWDAIQIGAHTWTRRVKTGQP
jgi:NADPH-dependent 2,4-dienoyl-CoA reductase/sulfur reductase-like enzyme